MSDQRRAENLKRFWEDTDVQDLFADLEADIQTEWRLSENELVRERCHAEMRALDKLKAKMEALIGAGEYEDLQDTRKSRTLRSSLQGAAQ